MFELKFDKKAIDFLNKLEKDIKQRIWNKLKMCK
jgi:mRNA-degrading endonuclease RelE of RelBE toxin-antitoxin system